jgi:hypothetical protein
MLNRLDYTAGTYRCKTQLAARVPLSNALSLNTTARSFILRQKEPSLSDSFFSQVAVCCVHVDTYRQLKPDNLRADYYF